MGLQYSLIVPISYVLFSSLPCSLFHALHGREKNLRVPLLGDCMQFRAKEEQKRRKEELEHRGAKEVLFLELRFLKEKERGNGQSRPLKKSSGSFCSFWSRLLFPSPGAHHFMAKKKNLVNLKCQRIFAVWIKKTITIFGSV